MRHFPLSLAGILTRLTYLSLRSNKFTQLPAALTQITTLIAIDLSNNYALRLNDDNVGTMITMPHLRGLGVGECRISKLSESSRAVVQGMSEQFELIVDDWEDLITHVRDGCRQLARINFGRRYGAHDLLSGCLRRACGPSDFLHL